MRGYKFLLVGIVSITLLSMTRSALPGVVSQPDSLYDASKVDQWWQENKVAEIIQHCRSAIKNQQTGADLTLAARRELAVAYLIQDDLPAARNELTQLWQSSPDDPLLPRYLQYFLDKVREHGKSESAAQLLQELHTNNTRPEEAIWLQTALAITDVQKGRDQAVQTSLNGIIEEYAADQRTIEAVNQIAYAYRKQNQHVNSARIYRYVIEQLPPGERRIYAQRGLVLCAIGLGDTEAAQQALDKLLTEYQGHPLLTGSILRGISLAYQRKGLIEEARSVYRYTLTQYPQDAQAIMAQRDEILCSVDLQDQPAAQAGLQALLQNFSKHDSLPEVLSYLADHMGPDWLTEQASLYRAIIEGFGQHELAIRAKAKLAQVTIQQGDRDEAEVMLQRLERDYALDPRLGENIFRVGEGYYDRAVQEEKTGNIEQANADFRRAIEVWERIPTRLPNSDAVAEATYFIGVVYRRHLGDLEKAVQYYEKVAEEYPDYRFAWSAQGMLGSCYAQLKQAGQIMPDVADAQIQQAYERLVQRYPESCMAQRAYLRLGSHSLRNQDYQGAASHYETYLEKYPNSRHWTSALAHLGLAYDRAGDSAKAAEIYRIYTESVDPADRRYAGIKARLAALEGKGL